MKISVIMPSYMGSYQHCATGRPRKFRRAVKSFIDQPYPNKELIIVADGCQETLKEYQEHKKELAWPEDLVQFIYLPKQETFSGIPRNEGIRYATGEIICYLDSDDLLFGDHLAQIAEGFSGLGGPDWVYFNDYSATDPALRMRERETLLKYGRMGTSTIAHKHFLNITWKDGYSHDWNLILQLIEKYPNNKKIRAGGYLVCHIPPSIDF